MPHDDGTPCVDSRSTFRHLRAQFRTRAHRYPVTVVGTHVTAWAGTLQAHALGRAAVTFAVFPRAHSAESLLSLPAQPRRNDPCEWSGPLGGSRYAGGES